MNGQTPYVPKWIGQRDERGPREVGRDVHYDLCNGIDCPCFQEGGDVRATSHYEMLLWFAHVDPEQLCKALIEVGVMDPLTNVVCR